MTLSEYRKAERLSQARFAEVMSSAGFPTTQALVSQWESGAVELSAERCAQIEQVTAGTVRRIDLRPDLFGPLPQLEQNRDHLANAVPGGPRPQRNQSDEFPHGPHDAGEGRMTA